MFFRQKRSGDHVYLQIVENRWEKGGSKQRVIATVGRLDQLQKNGQLDGLLQSGAKFTESVMVLAAHRQGKTPAIHTRRIGPAMVFGRLWDELHIPQVVERLLAGRRLTFALERILFLTVLHRLFDSGSDRSCVLLWKKDYTIPGIGAVDLHHVYRAMAWLGERLPEDQQKGATPFAPRCTKDAIEEALFDRRRDLFSHLDLVFFDTTSIYFEGEGGAELGQYGHSKDHRPDCKQMVVGAILDGQRRPLCCELWPGNVTDVKTLTPVVDRLQQRFRIRSICIVADRGMISQDTIAQLQAEKRQVHFILGTRLRNVKEIYENVLSRGGRYREVHGPREKSTDPSPLKVKEIHVADRRYVVCLNEEQAKKDRADRKAIVEALREQLKHGDKSLVGNKGYRKYLHAAGPKFTIDEAKVKWEERFDGKWVLQTDLEEITAEDTALQYKQLWMVEEMFRTVKTLLETRPIFHKCDETIRGHVFCSFLALLLRKELQDRLEAQGDKLEWAELLRDLESLQYTEVENQGKRFLLRSDLATTTAAVFRAAGVAIPVSIQKIEE
ncbi:MAG: IS1634 family transposase [Kiritimatiellae bacterium]|nr:IS1634 family transposase [Kiritimatiellia bacterium]